MKGTQHKSLALRPIVKSLWSGLFVMALSITLLFQACGADTAEQPSSPSSQAATETLATEHKGDKPTATPDRRR